MTATATTTQTDSPIIPERRQEMLLWDIEFAAEQLFKANRQLLQRTTAFENNLIAGLTGATPDSREVEQIVKAKTELMTLIKAAKLLSIGDDSIEEYVALGTARARERG